MTAKPEMTTATAEAITCGLLCFLFIWIVPLVVIGNHVIRAERAIPRTAIETFGETSARFRLMMGIAVPVVVGGAYGLLWAGFGRGRWTITDRGIEVASGAGRVEEIGWGRVERLWQRKGSLKLRLRGPVGFHRLPFVRAGVREDFLREFGCRCPRDAPAREAGVGVG